MELSYGVVLRIFLLLDGRSLTRAARVCHLWRDFLLEHVWRSHRIRSILADRLDSNWKNLNVTKSFLQIKVCLVNECMIN